MSPAGSGPARPAPTGPDRHPPAPTGQPATGPLAGLRVIVCRAEDDAGPLVDELRAQGAQPVLVPLVERAAPADGGAALRAAVARLDHYRWIAATSAAGVTALVDALAGRPLPPGLRVAAVGPATAAAFAAAGIEVDLVPASATAADLAAAFPSAPLAPEAAVPDPAAGPPAGAGPTPPMVLAPLAEAATDDLASGLTARGYQVDRVDAYRLVDPDPDPDPDRGAAKRPTPVDGAGALLLTAPSVVDRFLDRFGPAGVPPVVVAIGPRTADRARLRGLPAVTVAAEHTGEGLVAALLAAVAASADPARPG